MAVTATSKELNLAATLSLTTLITRSRLAHKPQVQELEPLQADVNDTDSTNTDEAASDLTV